ERARGAPLVVELETRPRLHLALPGAGRDLLPVLRRVVPPDRILRGRGAGFRPAIPHEATRHVTRGILRTFSDFLLVPRRLGAPRRVGVQLRDRVLLLLVRGGRGEGRGLRPLVLQHQTLCRALGVHGYPAALPYFGGLLGGRLEAAEGGCGDRGGEPGLRPAHSCSLLCVCASVRLLPLLFTSLTRTGWDSNPRYPCGHTGFRDRPFQPLTHLSTNGWRTEYRNRRTDAQGRTGEG